MKSHSRYLFMIILAMTAFLQPGITQHVDELLIKVKSKLDKVNDYEASGKMKTNVVFIKAPVANVKVYYKKPNRLKINNEAGISFIPRGSVNINLNNVVSNTSDYDLLDAGLESGTGLRIIKLLPRNENADIVLSILFVDEKNYLIKKAKTTTRESGTFELEMTYGKYSQFGLADKVVFTFNTKEYKMPKGITFDYDDGSGKKVKDNNPDYKKGKIEISYSFYKINKGIPDSFFD